MIATGDKRDDLRTHYQRLLDAGFKQNQSWYVKSSGVVDLGHLAIILRALAYGDAGSNDLAREADIGIGGGRRFDRAIQMLRRRGLVRFDRASQKWQAVR